MNSVTAHAAPNIAFIKYWGNRNNVLRLPIADSFSMTLSAPTVNVTVSLDETFSVRSFDVDGGERELKPKEKERFHEHWDLTKRYLADLGVKNLPDMLSIIVRSQIPPAIGLASSAAVFAATAKAFSAILKGKVALNERQESIVARLGSGSASRSMFGGFAALRSGEGDAIDSAYGEQIASEQHWKLWDIIVAPHIEEKKVGSTEGHALAHTSPLFNDRVAAIHDGRQQRCIDAVKNRDFKTLQEIAEEDSLEMHKIMETSTPPIRYLTEDSYRICDDIRVLREEENLSVLFTMDAGATVHLICTEDARDKVLGYAKSQEANGCTIYEASVGRGAYLV